MLSHFSCICLFMTLWTVARQAPLSMGSSRQEYCSGLPCPPPGDLPDPGIKPKSFKSPVWQVDPLLLAPPGKPKFKPTFFQVASPLLDLIESFGETKSQASNKDFPQSSQVSIEKLKEKYCLCLLEIIRRASRLLRGVICFLWVKCIFIFYIKRYLKCLC